MIHGTKKTIPEATSFWSLPDEITENILARISRWNYPSLSLVSKRFHSLLSSMELYKTRSQIGTKETFLYFCLQLPNLSSPSWFTLWKKPNQTPKKRIGKLEFNKYTSGHVLVPIPSSSDSPPISARSTVAVGSDIYVFGGPEYASSTSSVRILDCRSHTWRDGPNMTMPRKDASVGFIDGKIYVMGRYACTDFFEVFDIKTQSWKALKILDDVLLKEFHKYYKFLGFEGKIYVVALNKNYNYKPYIYKPEEDTWEIVRDRSRLYIEHWCVIEDVMYGCTYSGHCIWYDSKVNKWKVIEGLEELRMHIGRGLKFGSIRGILNYSGKLLVMWNPYLERKNKNKIWYAEISLETRCNGSESEVWGYVEWVDVMLTVPHQSYNFLHCLTVSA